MVIFLVKFMDRTRDISINAFYNLSLALYHSVWTAEGKKKAESCYYGSHVKLDLCFCIESTTYLRCCLCVGACQREFSTFSLVLSNGTNRDCDLNTLQSSAVVVPPDWSAAAYLGLHSTSLHCQNVSGWQTEPTLYSYPLGTLFTARV